MSVIEGCENCKGTGKIHVSYTSGITYHVENCPECFGLGFVSGKKELEKLEDKKSQNEIIINIEVCSDCYFFNDFRCTREQPDINNMSEAYPKRVPSSKPISCKIKRMKIILEE